MLKHCKLHTLAFSTLNLSSLTLACLLLFSGCGYEKALSPAEPKGFIERKETNLITEKTPFQYVWRNPDAPRRRELVQDGHYTIYIAPVDTSLLSFEGKDEALEKRVDEIATYLREQVGKEIGKYDGEKLKASVVEDSSQADLVLEMALTEIGFGSPLLYTGAWLVPLPGTGTAVDSMHAPVLAMEAKLEDSKTQTTVVELADRRIPEVRILDLNKVTSKMSPLRDVSNKWAEDLGRGLQTDLESEELPRRKYFTLVPW